MFIIQTHIFQIDINFVDTVHTDISWMAFDPVYEWTSRNPVTKWKWQIFICLFLVLRTNIWRMKCRFAFHNIHVCIFCEKYSRNMFIIWSTDQNWKYIIWTDVFGLYVEHGISLNQVEVEIILIFFFPSKMIEKWRFDGRLLLLFDLKLISWNALQHQQISKYMLC